ncbi:MAG TPA: GNAT family N-acetyltransferase [Bacteroidales bacterium]|nr:GNAT family N-acetyltransferase [Bacteroidales bacterium]
MTVITDYSATNQDKLDGFFHEAFQSCGFAYEPEGKHSNLRNIDEFFVKTGGGFWVLMQENNVVGSAGLFIYNKEQLIGELKCLYLLPSIQGKGYGQLMMKKVIEEAKHRKLHYLRLDVKQNAFKAINLYHKNSFYEIDRYNGNPNDVIFMELNLKNQSI